MNKVILVGRLTRDPEVRYSQGENPLAVARYTLAVDKQFKKQGEQTADFISCTAIGKNGEFAAKHLKQGMKILVEGRWTTGTYTNKDGVKVYTNECTVERHEFVESKGSSETGYQATSRPAPSQATGDGFMDIPDGIDEELPFN